MAAKDERFLLLSGRIKRKDGSFVKLHRGDEIPSDADAGDLKRLRSIGAIGAPEAKPEPEPVRDEARVFADDEFAQWAKDAKVEQILEVATPENAAELIAIEGEHKNRSTLIEKLSALLEGGDVGEAEE